MPSDSLSGKDPLSGLQVTLFLLNPHLEGRRGRERDREGDTGTEKTNKLTDLLIGH